MDELAVKITENVLLPLFAIAIILHIVAISLLLYLPKRRNQDVIFLHISASEICMCCCEVTQNILSRSYNVGTLPISIIILIQISFFVIPNILFMLILTLERFGKIYFGIKYPIYFSRYRLGIVLSLTWMIGIICSVIALPLKLKCNINTLAIIFTYIFPILESTFLVVAVIVYSYIYKKFYEVKNFRYDNNDSQRTQARLKKVNFIPPFLIIFNFIVFVIAPDIANMTFFYLTDSGEQIHTNTLVIIYVVGFINDAIIYIFLQLHLRKLLFTTLKRGRAFTQTKVGSFYQSQLSLARRTTIRNGNLELTNPVTVNASTNDAHGYKSVQDTKT